MCGEHAQVAIVLLSAVHRTDFVHAMPFVTMTGQALCRMPGLVVLSITVGPTMPSNLLGTTADRSRVDGVRGLGAEQTTLAVAGTALYVISMLLFYYGDLHPTPDPDK
jgi:hypothetical protein